MTEQSNWLEPFTAEHRRRLADPNDAIHECCDALVPNAAVHGLDVARINALLHDPTRPDAWPQHLVAFASNGCGDYYAYDLRGSGCVRYIDPDHTVEENLAAVDLLTFPSFETWYEWKARRG